MKMHEPIGPTGYGPMLLRITLGGYILLAGYNRLRDVPTLVAEVKKLNILPEHLAQLYGMLIPYLAVVAGALLLIGMWTTLASIISSLVIGSVIYALRGYPNSIHKIFDRDFVLLACSLSLLYTGAGAFSIDTFRKSG